jgi:hypothetical protein
VTMLPPASQPLRRHLHDVNSCTCRMCRRGLGVSALCPGRKYPNASREWIWQYVFPAARPPRDPRTGIILAASHPQTGLAGSTPLSVRPIFPTQPALIRCATRLRRISSKRV